MIAVSHAAGLSLAGYTLLMASVPAERPAHAGLRGWGAVQLGLASALFFGCAGDQSIGGLPSFSATVAVASPPAVNECATPQPGWIWCDDFEEDRLSRYTYWNHPESFQRVAGVGTGGSYGMRAQWAEGQVVAGSLWMAMGQTPMSGWNKADAGTAIYREGFWRMYLRTQPGWLGGSFYKLSRAMGFATANWAPAAVAHGWGDPAATNTLQLDPARGTDAAGDGPTTSDEPGAAFTWLGAPDGRAPPLRARPGGQGECMGV